MRTFITILAAALIASLLMLRSVWIDRRDAQRELARKADLLRVREAELERSQKQLGDCSSSLYVSSVSVDELRKRGNVVLSADAWMELVCIPVPDRAFDPNQRVSLSTSIRLATPAASYTFVTRRLEPIPLAMDEQRQVHLVLPYEPLFFNELIGKPIDDLASVTQLVTTYNDVLHAVGLRLAPDGVRTFVLNINGVESVRVQGFHASVDPPGDISWDVSRQFSALPSAYNQALQARINQRANSAAPPS